MLTSNPMLEMLYKWSRQAKLVVGASNWPIWRLQNVCWLIGVFKQHAATYQAATGTQVFRAALLSEADRISSTSHRRNRNQVLRLSIATAIFISWTFRELTITRRFVAPRDFSVTSNERLISL
jgi:hypothetical protein